MVRTGKIRVFLCLASGKQSDSESEGEGQIASFLEDPSLSQNRSSRSTQKCGLGIGRHHDRPASERPGEMDSPAEHVATSPSNPTTDDQTELESAFQSTKQGNTSSQASESSSANLKSSFIMEKRIMTIENISLELPQGNPHTTTDSTESETLRPFTSVQSPPREFEPSSTRQYCRASKHRIQNRKYR